MQRISDSSISLGNDYNQPYSSSYSSMTQGNIEYSKPEIIRKSGKSDIFNRIPINESPKRYSIDRNASTVFSREPINQSRPQRKRQNFDSTSDLFYEAKFAPSNVYDAAPSAEEFYVPSSAPMANSNFTSESKFNQDISGNDSHYSQLETRSGKSLDYKSEMPSLAAFEEKLQFDKVQPNSFPRNRHADIFSDQGEFNLSRGRRHYGSHASSSDIFNTNASKSGDSSRNRREIEPSIPNWKAGSSFSNVFGGSADSLQGDYNSRGSNRSRMEPSSLTRPSGLSSMDLNRERLATKGRPTHERSQDQLKSQIWF